MYTLAFNPSAEISNNLTQSGYIISWSTLPKGHSVCEERVINLSRLGFFQILHGHFYSSLIKLCTLLFVSQVINRKHSYAHQLFQQPPQPPDAVVPDESSGGAEHGGEPEAGPKIAPPGYGAPKGPSEGVPPTDPLGRLLKRIERQRDQWKERQLPEGRQPPGAGETGWNNVD